MQFLLVENVLNGDGSKGNDIQRNKAVLCLNEVEQNYIYNIYIK